MLAVSNVEGRMNLDKLQGTLIATAQAHPPSDAVPFGFERRVTTRLKALVVSDYWALWARGLWRAAAPCVALAVVLAILAYFSGPGISSMPDIAQEFDNTVLAAATLDQPAADSLR
jgi:hypothetical protein